MTDQTNGEDHGTRPEDYRSSGDRDTRQGRQDHYMSSDEADDLTAASRISDALKDYWSPIEARADHSRGMVTGRIHLNSVMNTLIAILQEHDIEDSWIRVDREAILPGSYGTTRQRWDLAIIKDDIPLGALNITAQQGSPGKNFSNRMNESMGTALSIRTAYDSSELSKLRPSLGLLYIVSDSPELNRPQGTTSSTENPYTTFKERMVDNIHILSREGLYDAATYVISNRDSYRMEEDPAVPISRFVEKFAERVFSVAKTCEEMGVTSSAVNEMITRRMKTGPDAPKAPESIDPTRNDADDSGLIFRVYIPSDRLYSSELDYFLSIFRSWMTDIRGYRLRQDGYETPTGKVCEFHLANNSSININNERTKFASFLDLCERDPSSAADQLAESGMSQSKAFRFATKYGRQARRLNADIKYARDTKIRDLQHDIECDLIDSGEDSEIDMNQVSSFLEALVPNPSSDSYSNLLEPPAKPQGRNIEINITQQIIKSVHGSVNGTANFGTSAKELLALIDEFGGQRASSLRNDLFEVDDQEAPLDKRRRAKKRLLSFLTQVSDVAKTVAVDLAEKYLEAKVGF